jgi:hypothetical protein
MKPKTPLPWEPSNNVGLIRMLPEDYNFAVHAVNAHDKLVADREKLVEFLKSFANNETINSGPVYIGKARLILKEIGE